MGLMDNIRGFFSGSKNNQTAQPQINEDYEKSRLADIIVDLIYRIKKINCFDSVLWNLSNVSSYDLQRKSLNELQKINSTLKNRLEELNKQKQTRDPKREAIEENIEAAKWTGQKPKNMSDHDFDRLQRDD